MPHCDGFKLRPLAPREAASRRTSLRISALTAALLCAVLVPTGAFAAVYDFTSNEVSAIGDPSFNFQLDTALGVKSNDGATFSDVTIHDDGVASTGNTVSFASPTQLGSPLFFFSDTDVPGPKAFGSGTGTDVTFNVGSYKIADGFTEGAGALTISESGVSGAPEPSTWLLLFAGIAVTGLMLRRAKTTTGFRFRDSVAARHRSAPQFAAASQANMALTSVLTCGTAH